MVRMIHFVCSPQRLLALLFVGALFFAACGQVDLGVPPSPAGTSTTKLPKAQKYNMFPKGTIGTAPSFPKSNHLSACSGNSDCLTGTECVNLFGQGGVCFFKCDPIKGTGEKQNPDCIEPENCVELNNGSGVCVAIPGQLYGIGGFKAFVKHKQGERCLLQYGGCYYGLVCVDTKQNGSIGTCEEVCENIKSKCQTAGTTCKPLVAGTFACLK